MKAKTLGKKLGRPHGRTLSGALLACSGIKGDLHVVARQVLMNVLVVNGHDRGRVALDLGVTERTVRRLCEAYGLGKLA